MFPGLGSQIENEVNDDGILNKPNKSKKHIFKHPVSGQEIEYDSVCAAESYISSKSIDDDLLLSLANNSCYGTVSEYCAVTTRGYSMLSTMLMTAGMCLSFMAIRNQLVDPTQRGPLGTISIAGYCLCFLTGITMTSVGKPVFRNANIWLTTNIPESGSPSKVIKLHTFGIVSFCLIPMLCHLVYAIFNKETMPNYSETMAGIAAQLGSAIVFGVIGVLPKYIAGFSNKDANRYGIATELLVVFSSFLAFVNFEYYSTASCAGHLDFWHGLLIVCMCAPFLLVTRHFCWAPTSFTTPPALMLMNGDVPVATFGPCPAIAFNGSTFNPDGAAHTYKELPRIKYDPEDMKL